MKDKILIHKNGGYSKINIKWLIALLPLICYGIYKNGIIVYLNAEAGFVDILKPLLFPLLGVLSSLLINLITKDKILNLQNILNGLLAGMVVPINTNPFIFLVLTLVLLYISKLISQKININISCLIHLIVVGILFIMNNYSYANLLEATSSYAYNFMDLFFGRQIGGVSSTSVFFIIISFIYLLTDYYYKKEIPIFAYISYAVVVLLSFIWTNDINSTLKLLISATPLFAFVFIAPISIYSPYTFKGKMLYGILIGALTAVLSFFLELEAAFIVLLVLSALKEVFDNLMRQKMTK